MLLGVNGGQNKKCVACVIVVSLVEQLALDNSISLSTAGANLCSDMLSGPLHPLSGVCTLLLDGLLPSIQNDFNAGKSPDYSCVNTLKMCTGYEKCELYKTWPPASQPNKDYKKHFNMMTTWSLHQIAKDAVQEPNAIQGHHFPLIVNNII